MQKIGNEVEREPHSMIVIVSLTLSASPIAMPPSGPMSLSAKLQTRVENWNDRNAAPTRQQMRRGGSKGRRAVLDGGDRLVDFERLDNRHATLGAEFVPHQAGNKGGRGVIKIGMIGMLLPTR
jgi:hypothetical protein